MKKIFCIVAVIAMMAFPAFADEGMWLLPLLQQMNEKAMKDLGCNLSAEDIYSINNSSLKDAIVQFGGGCTGEMISSNGLLITNHHCGYGTIQSLSTPEHNYLEDGYWAMKPGEEIPAPKLTVTFLESITDVTPVVMKAFNDALKEHKGKEDCDQLVRQARKAAERSLEKSAREDYPNCEAKVTSFYNQNVYYLLVYKTYRDIRFVGAPPAALGKFGGDTDNWMWPRQTCDFSMFRVYAGKDNEPADYSEENVPYRPKQHLKVSNKGVKEGDFTMIMGYPGGTQRFQTADQLESMLAQNDVAVKARTIRLETMWDAMEADPVVRLKYSSKYAGISNGWKKWQGEQLAVDKLDVIGKQRRKEAGFTEWVNQNKKRKEAYGTALDEISAAVATSKEPVKDLALLTNSVWNIGPISVYNTFKRMVASPDRRDASPGGPGGPDDPGASAPTMSPDMVRASVNASFKDYDEPLEKKLALALLEYYREAAKPEFYLDSIGDFANMDLEAYVDDLFENSAFSSAGNFAKVNDEDFQELVKNDPVAPLCSNLQNLMHDLALARSAGQEGLADASRRYTAGLLEWKKGEASYPDANFTMRLTYGTVKPYTPKDGVLYKHYTTLTGVIEKEDPTNYEFRVPGKIKELYAARDFGNYAGEDGMVPACFLSNNDITGGNSGSPVLNADGELIGLAFDGNWESMSSDIMFEPDLQRCINVDIRYVLFVIDKFGGAGYLLDEMDIEE